MFILPTLKGLAGNSLSSNTFKNAALDLNFASSKSLTDVVSGQNLVTFTRVGSAANAATYVGSDGLVKTAVTNLMLRSEEIGTSPWGTNVSGSVTYTANATAAPTGAVTADQVTATADFAGPNQFISVVSGLNYAFSFYIKAVTPGAFDAIRMECFSSRFAQFNITTGAFSGVNAAITPSSIPVGNNWVRVQMLFAAPSTGSLAVAIYANTSSDFYLWGAQLEQASTAGDYIPTTSVINSAPRFDHNPTTGESLGLLVEEARTNLLVRSEELDNASWGKFSTTVSANAVVSPTGNIDADLVIDTSTSAEHYIDQTCSTTTNQAYTQVIFAKAGTAPSFRIMVVAIGSSSTTSQIIFTQTAGVFVASSVVGLVTSATAVAVGNGWYRCAVTYTLNGTVITHQMRIYPYLSGIYAGTGLGTYFWGAQLEAGAFATSYIPTTSATVTRAADVASITGTNFSSWYNQSTGSVFISSSLLASVNTYEASFTDNTNNNHHYLRYLATQHQLVSAAGGIANTSIYSTGGASQLLAKTAYAYGSTEYSISSNGLLGTFSSTTGTIPATINSLNIGSSQVSSATGNLTIKRLTYWPVRLANPTLQSITSP